VETFCALAYLIRVVD